MCVSSTWVTTCHVPHVHMGTCTCRFMKARAKTCLEQLEELRNNFKVELRWLPLTESTQIFLCDFVCVSSTWWTMCHVVHMHVGTCTCCFTKAHAKTCLEQLEELWSNFFVLVYTALVCPILHSSGFHKVDPSPALIVRPPWRYFLFEATPASWKFPPLGE